MGRAAVGQFKRLKDESGRFGLLAQHLPIVPARVAPFADLLLIEGLQLRLKQGQLVELVVLGNRGLPPGRCLDRLDLAVAPGHRVGDSRLQAALHRRGKRLIKGCLGLLDAGGQDVLAGHGRKRDGGQQATDYNNEDEST